jgi:putative FmdB family regulatory protein
MPIYIYECKSEHITESYRTVEDRHKCPACEQCGGDTRKLISYVQGTYGGGEEPMTDVEAEWHMEHKIQTEKLMRDDNVEINKIGKGKPELPERLRVNPPRVNH